MRDTLCGHITVANGSLGTCSRTKIQGKWIIGNSLNIFGGEGIESENLRRVLMGFRMGVKIFMLQAVGLKKPMPQY